MIFSLLFTLMIALSCFFTDLTLWGAAYTSSLFLSRCFFYVLVGNGERMSFLVLAALCVLLQGFIFHDSFGAELLIMIPLALIFAFITMHTDLPLLLKALLATACVSLHSLFVNYGLDVSTMKGFTLGGTFHFIAAALLLVIVTHKQTIKS